MRTTKQILPGVKEIGWVRCEHLVNDIALRGISMTTWLNGLSMSKAVSILWNSLAAASSVISLNNS